MPQGIGITCKKRGRVMQMVAVACAEDEIRRTVGYFQPESRPGRPCGAESPNVGNHGDVAREHDRNATRTVEQAPCDAFRFSGLRGKGGRGYSLHDDTFSVPCRNCRPHLCRGSRAVLYRGSVRRAPRALLQ